MINLFIGILPAQSPVAFDNSLTSVHKPRTNVVPSSIELYSQSRHMYITIMLGDLNPGGPGGGGHLPNFCTRVCQRGFRNCTLSLAFFLEKDEKKHTLSLAFLVKKVP